MIIKIKYLAITILLLSAIGILSLRFDIVQDILVDRAVERLVTSNLKIFPEEDSLSAVVCGSKSPLVHPTRAETCILVKAGDEYYIFDIGDKSVSNLVNWRIPLGKIKAVFISHLHLDHYSDLEDLHLWGWVGADRKSKLEVYGGEGILKVLDGIEAAIQYDNQYRNEHHGDIFAPLNVAGFNGATIDNFSKPVYENKDLKIYAFLVEHHPIEPSLGFKIKYKDRSIVISGDTTYSQSVLEASKNTDVLFHEAMSVELLEAVNAALPSNALAKIGIEDIQNYHTAAVDAAKLAKLANAGYLVLYHLLPAPRNAIMEDVFLRGVKDEFSNYILSKDGTMVALPTNSDEILIKHVN